MKQRWLAIALATVAALAWLLVPPASEACPQCASRGDFGTAQMLMLGAMILLPFGVAMVVVRIIRREAMDESPKPAVAKPLARRSKRLARLAAVASRRVAP